MLSMPTIFASFQVSKISKQEIVRRTANFQPSIWGDRFINYDFQKNKIDVVRHQQVDKLKTAVKRELISNEDEFSHQLNLLDAIQQLGVAYHFEHEIEELLEHFHATYHHHELYHDDGHLHDVALLFRLLRQHGYHISSDIFNKFKNSNGNFKQSLIADVSGMLNLYEATQLRVNGEDILDEALLFTTSQLKCMLDSTASYPTLLNEQIIEALSRPLRKSLERTHARRYISVYQDKASYSQSLLKLAKLEFNLVQSLHQRELFEITRWWKELDFKTKLPFARDRVVEIFFWVVGVYFEPQYSTARIISTKAAIILTTLDDIYDAYGTFEELEILTKAIERWDIRSIDELPDYMKIYFHELMKFFNEIDEVITKEGRSYRISYAIQAIKNNARMYFNEVQWLHKGQIPSMEEYMHVATGSIGYTFAATIALLCMGDIVTNETFEWLFNDPKILRASNIILRLMDDIVSAKFEKERGHPPSSIDCYMKQYGVLEQEAIDVFNKQVEELWNDINEEFLKTTEVPMPVLMRILNLARAADFLYKKENGFTQVGKMTKDHVTALFIDPVPM